MIIGYLLTTSTSFASSGCSDGSWGEFHIHPSLDKLEVRSIGNNGTDIIAEGDVVTISATVWVSGVDSFFVDFWYTNDLSSVEWQYIGTRVTGSIDGEETLELDYRLPWGTSQAVRAHLRYYLDPVSSCPVGSYANYGDADDLGECILSYSYQTAAQLILIIHFSFDILYQYSQ